MASALIQRPVMAPIETKIVDGDLGPCVLARVRRAAPFLTERFARDRRGQDVNVAGINTTTRRKNRDLTKKSRRIGADVNPFACLMAPAPGSATIVQWALTTYVYYVFLLPVNFCGLLWPVRAGLESAS